MQYYRTIGDENIVYISTLNKEGKGNIAKEEYETIRKMYQDAKPGYVVTYDGKEYSYMQLYDPSKGGLEPDEAWKIIESSNINKENKQKLYDYIYGKGGV